MRAALNSTLSFTKSCTYLSVRSVLRQDVPNNAGIFRCIDVIAPEGTILNPRLPGACAARALTGYRILDVMLGALAQALPERVPAAGEGGNTVVSIGGYNAATAGLRHRGHDHGRVGRPARQGRHRGHHQPVAEHVEHAGGGAGGAAPDPRGGVRLRPDACGAGRYRGGLGLRRRYTLLNEEAPLQLRSDRMRFPPYGLSGGGPARGRGTC